jgi:hypothetical protein
MKQTLTDELTDLREQARIKKDYALSDAIRNELDTRGSFCFDNPDGQVVYHLGIGYTREFVIKHRQWIEKSFETNKRFIL